MTDTDGGVPGRFSLPALVREVADANPDEASPKLIAFLVLQAIDRLPPGDQHLALVQMVTPFTRQVLASARPRGGFTSRLNGVAAANSARSSRVRGIRDAYLRSSYSIDGQWKQLRTCTAQDLLVIASGLEVQAGNLMVKAEDMRRLASELTRREAATVGDLPEDVLSVIFC